MTWWLRRCIRLHCLQVLTPVTAMCLRILTDKAGVLISPYKLMVETESTYDGTMPGLSCEYEDDTYCQEVDLLTSTDLCLRFPLEFYRII